MNRMGKGPHILSEALISRMCNREPKVRNESLMRLIYATGCRLSDALRIDRPDIAWHQQWAEIVLTGRAGRIRSIRIEGLTFEVFKRMCAENDQALDYVFQTCHGRLTPIYAHQIIREAAQRAGIKQRVNSEWLRQSSMLHKQLRGASLREIAATAGIALATAVKYVP
jgi:site-specific recombinase XerD